MPVRTGILDAELLDAGIGHGAGGDVGPGGRRGDLSVGPAMAALGLRVVAHDLRGFRDGARPEGVESYHLDEYIQDTVAIADELAVPGEPLHLMGTSIGSSIGWGLATKQPDRVLTLACINIPQPAVSGSRRNSPQRYAAGLAIRPSG